MNKLDILQNADITENEQNIKDFTSVVDFLMVNSDELDIQMFALHNHHFHLQRAYS